MKKTGDDRFGAKESGSRGWKLAGILCLAGALICTAVACAGKENQSQAEDEYDKLAEMTRVVATEKPEEPSPEPEPEATEEPPEEKDPLDILKEMGIPIPEKEVDFADLQENTNKDIYAWIYIPDTKIDYPVLQHPTDNSYYLNYNLDGSRGYPGCIYSEDYNTKNFSDPVTVLYGHNMKNGTMFAGLHRYSDSEYMEEHPYVYIYTEEGLLVYEVFAAHEYSNDHILYGHDYTDSGEMGEYLDDIKNGRGMNHVLREGVSIGEPGIMTGEDTTGGAGSMPGGNLEVTAGSRVLTLSTCISNKPDNRFLVQGVLLNGEGE